MKKTVIVLNFLIGWWLSMNVLAQTGSTQKMSVNDRMAKARAAKAEKKSTLTTVKTDRNEKASTKDQKATPADYRAPVVKLQKGPNGEVVRKGTRGGMYYINKNGNKTYLSSNQ